MGISFSMPDGNDMIEFPIPPWRMLVSRDCAVLALVGPELTPIRAVQYHRRVGQTVEDFADQVDAVLQELMA